MQGFWKSLISNHTYTPNQLFDLVLPQANLAIARIVGFMIRQTIGWTDKHNQPRRRQLAFTQAELAQALNLHENSINNNLRAASQANFITCVRKGSGYRKGTAATSSIYSLKWSSGSTYGTDPEKFDGFLPGQGNRTVVPNQFFDCVLLAEPLAVIKIVGLIIRKTIGWVDNFGNRKIQDAVSYREFMREMQMSRHSVAEGIKTCLAKGYICIPEKGQLKRPGVAGNSATYELFWVNREHALSSTKPNLSRKTATKTRPIRRVGNHPKNQTAQKGAERPQNSDRFDHKNQTETTTKIRPKNDHKNQTNKTKEDKKKVFKQQQVVVPNQEVINQVKSFIPTLQEKTIQDLIKEVGEDRVLLEIHLMHTGYRSYQDRAKFFIAALRNGYSIPDSYLQEPAGKTSKQELLGEYYRHTEAILEQAEASLSEEKKAELTEEIKTRLFQENPRLRDYKPQHLALLVHAALRDELRRELHVLSFKEWLEQPGDEEEV